MNKSKLLNISTFLILLVVFLIKSNFFLDPDYGWHVKLGELILTSGIPKTDPYSYTMPSYPYIEHAWLSDVLLFKLDQTIGFAGLALIFALVAVVSIFLAIPQKTSPLYLPFVLLGSSMLLPFAGIRTQLLTWLFFSLIIFLAFNEKLWRKFKYVIPLFILVWANLHGGFALGIFLLLLIFLIHTYQSKKLQLVDLGVFLASLGVSNINPYGVNIWIEVRNTVLNNDLRWAIGEWYPYILRFDFAFLVFVTVSAMLIGTYKKKLSLLGIALYLILLFSALASSRHMPLWVLVAISLSSLALKQFYLDSQKKKVSAWRFNRVIKVFAIICFIIFVIHTFLDIRNFSIFNEEKFYPKQAIEFLKTQNIPGQIFAPYGWGGYIIWKYPPTKTFVDGRMPTWRVAAAPPNESKYALEDYNKVLSADLDYQSVFEKYQIKTALLEPKATGQDSSFFNKIAQLDKIWTEKLLHKKPIVSLEERLEKAGWQTIYQDKIAIILVKPN
jgi:hypothetical protein